MWDKIKQHPWIAGALVGVFLLVLIVSNSGSSAEQTSAATTAESGNGDSLQAYLAGLNLQSQVASRAYDSEDTKTAAALEVARIQSSSTDLANELAAQVALFTTAKSAETQQRSDTLTAQTQQSIINAGVTNTQTVANALVQQQAIASETVKAVTSYNTQVQMANIAANENINRPRSWFETIFG